MAPAPTWSTFVDEDPERGKIGGTLRIGGARSGKKAVLKGMTYEVYWATRKKKKGKKTWRYSKGQFFATVKVNEDCFEENAVSKDENCEKSETQPQKESCRHDTLVWGEYQIYRICAHDHVILSGQRGGCPLIWRSA